jgi:hypothetical protein
MITEQASPSASSDLEVEFASGRVNVERYARTRDRRLGSSNFVDRFLFPLISLLIRNLWPRKVAAHRASHAPEHRVR